MTAAVLVNGDLAAATARNPEQLEDIAAKYPDSVYRLRLDVTNKAQIIAAVENTIKKFGRIDVLVNNAGFGIIGAAGHPLPAGNAAGTRRGNDRG